MTNQQKSAALNSEIEAIKLLKLLSPFQSDAMKKQNSLGISLKNNPDIESLDELEEVINDILEPLNKKCFVPKESKKFDNDVVFVSNFTVSAEQIHKSIGALHSNEEDEIYLNTLTTESMKWNLG